MLRVQPVLLGLDGGATELKAHEVVPLFAGAYELGAHSESRLWSRHPDCARFEPVPLAEQRAPDARAPAAAEQRAAAAWVELTVDAIVALARSCGAREVVIGACFPGLKTPDARGIAVSRNGPRIPDFASRIEHALRAAGFVLAAPIAALHSDGYCCGVGEQRAPAGALRDVRHAYYLGGGTGLPEAFVLDGEARALDELAPALRKAWQLEVAPGRSFEDVLAPAALNREWRVSAPSAHADAWVEQAAALGDPRAAQLLERAGAWLAALCFERLARCAAGEVGGARRVLERIVLGQRLGQLWESEGGATLRAATCDHLAEMLRGAHSASLQRLWLERGQLAHERVRASRLRAAPALGAAVLAREARGA